MWSQVFPLLVLALCSSAWSQESMTKEQIEAYKWATGLFKKNMQNTTSQTIDNRFHTDLTPVKPNTSVAKSCVTEDKVKGVCTKTSLCNKEAPKIDPENGFILRDRDLCHILEICCPMGQVLQLPKKPGPAQDRGCGYSNPGASVFRQKTSKNGYADYGEFPWMVALLKAGSGGWSEETYLGGGTIIHLSVVMTVAHKVDTLEPSDLKCRAGEWDTQTDKEAFDYQERDVAKIILHEDFDRVPVHNNIALLTLKQPFIKEPHVGVACLSLTLPPPGTVCYSMGWGEDFTKSDKYSNLLKKITLPLVGRDTCEMRYRNTRLGSGYKLHRTLTCAGGEAGVDTCLGDGGSSLVCPVGKPAEQRYAVVGMVAYGLECGTKNVPGVYVKVPEFFDWVGGRLVREGFNRSSFELETESLFKLRS